MLASSKTVPARVFIVHRTFAALPPKPVRYLSKCGELTETRQFPDGEPDNSARMIAASAHETFIAAFIRCPDCAGTARRLPRNAGRAMIWIYRHTLSPLVGYNCRHLPTCSVYGDEAIERFGLWAGGWMTLARLLRCQPWGTSGIDNVPLTRPAGARWYLPWRFGRWRGVNAP